MKIDLIVIDPQNSFCKVVDPGKQQVLHDGELCVPGAWKDMENVAGLVRRLGGKLNDIHVTMDSHHKLHIAHPLWFVDRDGNHPNPFTLVTLDGTKIIANDFLKGQLVPKGELNTTVPSFREWTVSYLRSLEGSNRYAHCIWPYHCLIGTPGHNIVTPLYQALDEWCQGNMAIVDIVTKGSNPKVEHFSAVKAEVEDQKDLSTQFNDEFFSTVMDSDEILLTGEALSHCLANTVRDMAGYNPDFIKKCVLLTDCSSSVPGFESFGDAFIDDMVKLGMRTSTSVDYLK